MADEKPHEILIIKRARERDDYGHGGAWKIAFADFMTAMMALFLVLWLISATNEKTKASLARYFNPVKLVDMTVQKRGLHDPVERSPEDAIPDLPNAKEKRPVGKSDPKDLAPAKGEKAVSGGGPADFQPKHSEAALFRDPYAVLAEIAGAGPSANPSDKIEHPNVGAAASFQDPFQAGAPVLPGQTNPSPTQGAGDQLSPGAGAGPGTANPPQPNAATPNPTLAQQVATQPADQSAATQPGSNSGTAAAKSDAKPTDAKNQAAGAGAAKSDLKESAADKGQAAKADAAKAQTAKNETTDSSAKKDDAKSQTAQQPAANQPKQPSAEELQLARLQNEVAGAVGTSGPMPAIQLKQTPQGILLSLTDGFNYAMFAVGSAEPQARTVQIMEKIAKILKNEKGDIVISGHTDGRQYKSRNYDNWRLSEARAQMALYMLVRGGLDEKRVVKIEGAADHELKVPNNPLADENRRIEILLRKSHS